ncbi:MAG: TetR/AcrR family transcriptional regulator [Verrucomicrobiota bacterium]
MVRRRTGDKDKQIVDASISLFLERGIRGSTIQAIAKKAGIAVGTVYVYHKDKAAIVRRVAFAFAERHDAFVASVLSRQRKPGRKLMDYLLGFYDIWRPFGKNTKGALELAEAVLKHAPETLGIAQDTFLGALASILEEAKAAGLQVNQPKVEARWLALCTSAFFPLAGTPTEHPMRKELERKDLEDLLKWYLKKIGN